MVFACYYTDKGHLFPITKENGDELAAWATFDEARRAVAELPVAEAYLVWFFSTDDGVLLWDV